MKTQFYEVVFEGHYKAVYGLLEGYLMGLGSDLPYYFSEKSGIRSETMTEIVLEWISLRGKLHHVIMEKTFYETFAEAVAARKDSRFVDTKFIRSAQLIRDATFTFEAETYGRKYGTEIKSILNNLQEGLELHDYNPVEKDTDDGKGIELYAPEHDYVYKATGRISGELPGLISFRKEMDDHPLIEVEYIELIFS